ncbi:hypothetical protein [Roseisolibacter sp. H3M3-2]|uniref:hypothetical protein n=1 Tax=Roseisolibacter sp. H3M3-2 TaxID=3031323 RepID=UPI0023DA83E0|nr:hypothetical protein [Roseisolibacter sp. H3M3-2]MDF1504786.1 hypothetical protein [Roseisolibacter sp. H3M3-2]
MTADARRRLLRAWLALAVVDFCFASALATLAYGGTFGGLWQGVASTVLGPSAIGGGAAPVLVGILLHVGVAFAWSAAFVALWLALPALRRLVATPAGVLAAAAVYGPLVWCVMSLAVIPTLTGRPPSVTPRWWIQLLAHVPFVALPVVASVGLGAPGVRAPAPQ